MTNTTQLAVATSERRNGKVARLPHAVRNRINTMIRDGIPYREIITRLGTDGAGLTEMNLSNWKNGGYVDWLREMQFELTLEKKYELARQIAASVDNENEASQALLQSVSLNLLDLMIEMDPSTIQHNLYKDADKFTRFLNSVIRLSQGGINCARHRFAVEDRENLKARQSAAPKNRIADSIGTLRPITPDKAR